MANKYQERILALKGQIPKVLVDFTVARTRPASPTQASTNFTTNKEQGDWAEALVFTAVNEYAKHHVAVKYGKSDSLVAGEDGFSKFYNEFQDELDRIGKRPDILIFKKEDYNSAWGTDISRVDEAAIADYVKKAVAGIEVRSSAFLLNRYSEFMKQRTAEATKLFLFQRDEYLSKYKKLLEHPKRSAYRDVLTSITPANISAINLRVPSWSSSDELVQAKEDLKEIKKHITTIQKRDFLSITPKVEDIKVVDKWIEIYGVPHFYLQVFFDKVFAIGFDQILEIASDPDNEGSKFNVEGDVKNQDKLAIKINVRESTEVAARVDEPDHNSVRKELDRGRLLFYVTFKGGKAYLDVNSFAQLLKIEPQEF